jgi:hypothetical protein
MPENIAPYVGPRPFERSEGGVFFGREKEIRQLVNLIYANSVVVFYSKSGFGKSSLLNAGVIPRLVTKGLEVLDLVRIAGQIPQHIRYEDVRNIYITNAIIGWEGYNVDPQQLIEKTLTSYLKEREHILTGFGQPAARVIIFDQFEELFFRYSDLWENRKDFFKQIQDALDQDYLLRVVFSLREDYLGELEPYTSLLRGKLQERFRLEGMSREDALAAVKNPLQAIGMNFGDGVAEMIVDNLLMVRNPTPDGSYTETIGQFIEPVQLQVVCRSLWGSLPLDLKVITLDYVSNFGDVKQNLSSLYDESIMRTIQETGVSERDLREWFEQSLITPMRTRGTIFRSSDETGGLPNNVVDILENLHIIRAEFRAGARWYELTHDKLIDPILESNKNWLTRSRGYSSYQ